MAGENEHGKFARRVKTTLNATKAKAKKFSDEVDWALGSRTARVLRVGVLLALVVAALFLLLNLYVAPTKPTGKKDLVLALAQILGGAALLSGLYFTWRTLQVNREGQITERFTRAIEHLGATHADSNYRNLELRLGGIYALERISRESEEDHWSIMEILTAYARQHSPWPEVSAVPAADIQAIVTVLRRRTRSFRHGEPEPLDLSETNLTITNLSGANLQGATLQEANFVGANLTKANLSGANLSGANLSGVDLSGANLSEATHLNQWQLEETTGSETTQLPSDLKPPTRWNWSVKTDEQIEGG